MKKLLVIIFLYLFSSLSSAKHTILMLDLDGWTSPSKLEEGNVLMNDFLSFTNLDIEAIFLPNSRAINSVSLKKYHCLFTGDSVIFEKYTNREALSINNLQIAYWRYVTPTKKEKITDFDQLHDLDLIILRGLKIDEHSLQVPPSLFHSIDQVQNFSTIKKMLLANRADVGYVSLQQNENIEGFHYDNNLKDLKISRGLNCAKDHNYSQLIIDEFNRFLDSKNH